jgi:hypothetical protein
LGLRRITREIPGCAAKIPFSRPSAAHNVCLKFNRLFEKCWADGERLMRYRGALFKRLLDKLLRDVTPTALASIVSGILFTHFHLGFGLVPEPIAQTLPASAEMMQLLRDEHALVVSYVKAQRVKDEKAKGATEGALQTTTDQHQTRSVGSLRPTYAELAAKAVAGHVKSAGPTPIPIQIAQARNEVPKPVSRDDDSLLAKTVGIKDHVVAATQRVVSTIGGLPSWIGSIGDRMGGDGANPRPPSNVVSAS